MIEVVYYPFPLLSLSFIHDHRVPQKINYIFLFLKSVLKFSTKNYSHGVHANTIPSSHPRRSDSRVGDVRHTFLPDTLNSKVVFVINDVVKYVLRSIIVPPKCSLVSNNFGNK